MSKSDEGSEELVPVSPGETSPDVAYDRFMTELGSGKNKKYARFIVAALGSIPWIGSLLGAGAGFSAEKDQEKLNELHRLWLQEHMSKVRELVAALRGITVDLDAMGDRINARIESNEYLELVRRTFRSWDQADTHEKRQMLKRLITNAGAIELCPDDLIRLFANWIDLYHEAHFLVIKQVYQKSGSTRGQIWDAIHPVRPREDSAEADLFRYLIRDLQTGGVIRNERETNSSGQFLKQRPGPRGSAPSRVMQSAFEDTKPLELTELGKQFVHYVMKDVAPQIGASEQSGDQVA